MLSLEQVAFLGAAGVFAAVVGTAGGITSLVSYPALLLAGLPAFEANVANLVAFVACWPGAAVASRRELREVGRWLPIGLIAAGAGGAAGTVLLLVTPSTVFEKLVPLLVASGSCLLLAQPRLTLGARPGATGKRTAAVCTVGLIAVYGGYFGAGSGVMLLAVCLILVDPRMPIANALKNMYVGSAAVISAAILITAGPVPWHAVVPLAGGLFLGSFVGPVLARHLPPAVVRWCSATLGFVLAADLLLEAL